VPVVDPHVHRADRISELMTRLDLDQRPLGQDMMSLTNLKAQVPATAEN
jgi:hypothetical protein